VVRGVGPILFVPASFVDYYWIGLAVPRTESD